jgi:hypothetical protein
MSYQAGGKYFPRVIATTTHEYSCIDTEFKGKPGVPREETSTG